MRSRYFCRSRRGRVRLATLFAAIVLIGCFDTDFRPAARGGEGVIYVVIDSSHWQDEVGEALRGTLGRYVETLPVAERAYELRPVSLVSEDELREVKRRKNVVFVATLSDTTAEARFLRASLSEEVRQEGVDDGSVYVKRLEPYRREQLIAYLAASTPEALAAEIRASGPELRDSFDALTRQRVMKEMFDHGRQEHVERAMLDRHGFAVNVQHDYEAIVDTFGTLYLRRLVPTPKGVTWRNLVIHYAEHADPADLSPEWMYAVRDSLTRQHMQGDRMGYVRIDYRRPLEAEEIDFRGRPGFEARGLWSLVQPNDEAGFDQLGMGGPFVSYAFYDHPSRRLYLIDGSIFAPGWDKRELVHQMEAVAYTFRAK